MFVQLTGGAYQSRSLIAAAQRCLNLFPEGTPQGQGEPIQVTHYCAPGLTLQNAANISPLDNGCRGLYTASNGELYACYDQHLLHYSSAGVWADLGTFHPSAPSDAAPRDNPVSMQDNGFVLLVVDGTVDGYFIDLTKPIGSQVLTRIDRTINTGWLGADNIGFQDTFFTFNSPGTTDWYISLSNITADNLTAAFNVFTATLVGATSGYNANDVLTLTGTGGAQVTVNSVDSGGVITGYGVTNGGALVTQPTNPVAVTGGTGTGATFNLTYETNVGGFDPLDFVSMEAQVTKCLAAISVHRNVWLLGETAYEIWVNTGGDGTSVGSFPFSLYPTGFGNWGCAAKYSIAIEMNRIFWLSQDKFGHGVVFMGEALGAKRVTTNAIEFEISQYPVISDAIGYCYQQMGHLFYVLTFPSANADRGATWVYDASTNEWHERCYIDSNGIEYRHLANAAAGAYGQVFVGDWRNGNLYVFDLDNYTDNGNPIKRLRSFPHQIDLEANRRIMYHQLIAQMQVGSPGQTEAAVTFLDCEFNAPDSTLLQNYHNINSFGANFIQIDPINAIIFNDAVIGQTPGDVLYQVAGTPDTPDYVIRYKVKPTDYTSVAPVGTIISIIGRATPAYLGYEASIYSDGSQYFTSLTIGAGSPMWLPLGLLTSGDYELYLSMQSTAITIQVYRSEDGQWLSSSGAWAPTVQTAIAITDSTYTTPGLVLIAGNWGGAGQSVGIDPSVSATASVGDLTVDVADLSILLNIIGLSITGEIGDIGDDLSQVIEIISEAGAAGLGVEASMQLGALSVIEANFITIGVAGVESASAPGEIAVSVPQSVEIIGVEIGTTVGTLGTDNETDITIGVSGVESASASGTIAVSIPQSLALTGVSAGFNAGTPGVQKNNTVSIGLAGVASPISAGRFTPLAQKSISTTGVAASPAAGTMRVSGITISIIGVQATRGIGTLTTTKTQNRTPLLPSVQAATQINGLRASTSTRQATLGATLGLWWGDTSATGDMLWSNTTTHMNGLTSAMGRAPTVLSSVGNNDAGSGFGFPSNWPGSDVLFPGWPVGISKVGVTPALVFNFTNGVINNAFTEFANGATTIYSGHTYDYWVQQTLLTWKNAGFNSLYIRPNWEFNEGFDGHGIRNAADVVNWIAAFKHFSNVCHQFAIDNSMTIKIVWCAAISSQIEAACFGLPCLAFFPQPDGSAIGGNYVDVIGPDVYAFGGDSSKFPESLSPNQNINTNQYWFFSSMVQIAQAFRLPIAICELGDFSDAAGLGHQIAWQSWIPNHFVPYMNSLHTLTPVVPIEFISLFDLTVPQAFEFSNPGDNLPNELAAWRNCLGIGGPAPDAITT